MKVLLLLTFILMTSLSAEEFNIEDRRDYQKLYREVLENTLSVESINNEESFKRYVMTLSSEQRSLLLRDYRTLSEFLPPLALRGILYHHYHGQSEEERAAAFLKYILLNKVMTLRDLIEQTGSQELLSQLREMTELPHLEINGLYQSIEPIIEAKAHAITQMEHRETFMNALRETKLIHYKLKGKQDFYQIGHLGIIPAFQISEVSKEVQPTDRIRLNEDSSQAFFVDFIKKAQKNIFIEQSTFSNHHIVDALIKKRIQNKNIDIRVIIYSDSLELPNTIFLKEMKKYGIKIRIHKGEDYQNLMLRDSDRVIFGSAEKSQSSMAYELFNSKKTRELEIAFESSWSDHKSVHEADIANSEMEINGVHYSKEFTALINDIAAFLSRSQSNLFD